MSAWMLPAVIVGGSVLVAGLLIAAAWVGRQR